MPRVFLDQYNVKSRPLFILLVLPVFIIHQKVVEIQRKTLEPSFLFPDKFKTQLFRLPESQLTEPEVFLQFVDRVFILIASLTSLTSLIVAVVDSSRSHPVLVAVATLGLP